jgi:hypothetical protein
MASNQTFCRRLAVRLGRYSRRTAYEIDLAHFDPFQKSDGR